MENLLAVFCCACPMQPGSEREEFLVSGNEDGSSMTTPMNLPKPVVSEASCIGSQKMDQPPAANLDEAANSELPDFSALGRDEERCLDCALVLDDDACMAASHQDEVSSETTRCLSDDSDCTEELQPWKSETQSPRSELMLYKADWWQAADLSAWACGTDSLAAPAGLRCARVVKHAASLSSFDAAAPWQPGRCEALHAEMGAQQPGLGYLAVWLKFNAASLVSVSALPKSVAAELGCRRNLAKDLKLILNPVHVPVPFPAKGPAAADTIASFFGDRATHQSVSQTSDGAEVACVQIDLFSNWLLRMALKQVGFRLGNVLELILVDWPGRQVVSAVRLTVTEDFLQLVR
jgi:hypothetical protein